MKIKPGKLLSALLAIAVLFCLSMAVPLTASAASVYNVGTAADFKSALDAAASGDTLRLTADVTYTQWLMISSGKTLYFDLNGKTLSATGGVTVSGGSILLTNPTNGQFNVSSSGYGSALDVYNETKVEVNNVTATGNCDEGIWGGGEVMVYGNVTNATTNPTINAYGVICIGGKVTINGVLTVPTGVPYIRVGNALKTQADYGATTQKAGYREYKDDSTGSYVWVKIAPMYTVTVQSDGNGTAAASASSAVPGSTVTLTVTPFSGYRLKTWQVISGGVTVSGNTFTMPSANVTIKAIFEVIPAATDPTNPGTSAPGSNTTAQGGNTTAPGSSTTAPGGNVTAPGDTT
ncbi:MAG: hypothetical protein FWF49_05845, partial [Oscillospiraceae bacterium]|nr:hypothetical protein [Oscillospiraceae bacterium]